MSATGLLCCLVDLCLHPAQLCSCTQPYPLATLQLWKTLTTELASIGKCAISFRAHIGMPWCAGSLQACRCNN